MKREDLHALRVPLLVLGITLFATVLVLYFSGVMLDDAYATRT
jgi:hypothetical protein